MNWNMKFKKRNKPNQTNRYSLIGKQKKKNIVVLNESNNAEKGKVHQRKVKVHVARRNRYNDIRSTLIVAACTAATSNSALHIYSMHAKNINYREASIVTQLTSYYVYFTT